MRIHPSDYIFGVLMVAIAALGVTLAVNALDNAILIFGVSLVIFAALFVDRQVSRVRAVAKSAVQQRKGNHV